MPSGKTHDRITAWGVPVVTAATLVLSRDAATTLAIAGGFAVGGFLLSPDLDIHSVPYKRWGPFRWMWLPYRKMFRHRSPWTHGVLVGTTIRVLYLMVWVTAAVAIAGALAAVLTRGEIDAVGEGAIAGVMAMGEWLVGQPWLWAIAVGLELGALSHVVADLWGSAMKKSHRRKSRKSRKTNKKSRGRSRSKTSHKPKRRSPKKSARKPIRR